MLIHLDDKYFQKIKNGSKTIELRLYDEKRRKINVGDIIDFENRKDKEIIKTQVIKLYIYPNFYELYQNLNKEDMGYSKDEIASYKDMEEFYSLESQEKYGVVGIEIKLI